MKRAEIMTVLLLVLTFSSGTAFGQADGEWRSGEDIYQKTCQYCHTTGEAACESLNCLLGQGDFRYETDASLPGGNNLGQGPKVDLRLAAACHAKQKKDWRTTGQTDSPDNGVMKQSPDSLLR